ncbi:MAG: sulfatase-like hydrolase/transferase [Planctomycetes bacterium]|nr:sulfatase-like hydrolase/transferase [Planctomycetota bacterium]
MLRFLILLALAAVIHAPLDAQTPPRDDTTAPTDFVWFVVDSLAPRYLAAWGSEDPVPTPNLDQLVAKGMVFERAYAAAPSARTGLISQLYSVHPQVIAGLGGTTALPSAAAQFSDLGVRNSAAYPTSLLEETAEPLGELSKLLDFTQKYWEFGRSPDKFWTRVERSLGRRQRRDRWFLFLNATAPEPPVMRFDSQGFPADNSADGKYRAAIRMVDRQIGEVVKILSEAGSLDSTLIIVSGSRGLAEIRPDQVCRQNTLTDATLHVPLVICGPGVLRGRRSEVVSTLDVLPTAMTLMRFEVPPTVQGRELTPLLRGHPGDWNGLAFSEHLPWKDEVFRTRAMSLRSDRGRLVYHPHSDRYELFGASGDDVSIADQEPELLRDMRGQLEHELIRDLAAQDLWSKGTLEKPDLEGPDGMSYRTRWLASRSDERTRDSVVAMIRDGRGDMVTAAELLLLHGEAADVDVARPLLQHADQRVRSLAGAFILDKGKQELGLDYAIQGLREDMPESGLLALLEILGKHRSDLAKQALESFQPAEGAISVAAYRDLALARQGLVSADQRLIRHVLEPNAPYSRSPFLESLEKSEPDRLATIITILIENVRLTEADALDALETLDRLGDLRAATAVASLVDHVSPRVRERAGALVRRWGSAAGAEQRIRSAEKEPAAIAEALVSALQEPGLLGSPALPGISLDLDAGNQSHEMRLSGGYPVLDGNWLDFRMPISNPVFGLAAVAFEVIPGSAVPDRIDVKLNLETKNLPTLGVYEHKGIHVWVGEILPGLLEPGINVVRLRLARDDRSPAETKIRAFVLWPNSGENVIALGGVDTRSGRDSVRLIPERHAAKHYLHLAAAHADGASIVVRCDGQVVLQQSVSNGSPGRVIPFTLPTPLDRDARVDLELLNLPEGAIATGMILSDRK